jgi:hypothetical protein
LDAKKVDMTGIVARNVGVIRAQRALFAKATIRLLHSVMSVLSVSGHMIRFSAGWIGDERKSHHDSKERVRQRRKHHDGWCDNRLALNNCGKDYMALFVLRSKL